MIKHYLTKCKDMLAIFLFISLYILTDQFKYSKVIDYTGIYKLYFLSFFIWVLFYPCLKMVKINFFVYNMLTPLLILLFSYAFLIPFYHFYSVNNFFMSIIISYYHMGYFYISLIMIIIDLFLYFYPKK